MTIAFKLIACKQSRCAVAAPHGLSRHWTGTVGYCWMPGLADPDAKLMVGMGD